MEQKDWYSLTPLEKCALKELLHDKYKSLSFAQKDMYRSTIVSIPNLCGGDITLKGHRLQIEFVAGMVLDDSTEDYSISYSKEEIDKIVSIWVFEYC